MDYNEQVIGNIDFVLNYDKFSISDKEITDLMNDIIKTLKDKYAHLSMHFEIGDVEDSDTYEMNQLIKTAHDRRNSLVEPMKVLANHLTNGEMNRFIVLQRKKGETK